MTDIRTYTPGDIVCIRAGRAKGLFAKVVPSPPQGHAPGAVRVEYLPTTGGVYWGGRSYAPRSIELIASAASIEQAHAEALAEGGARVVLAEAMDRPWSESVHPRIRAYHAALEGSTAARYDLAAAHRYAIERLYDEALDEDDTRGMLADNPPVRPLSRDVARSAVPAPQLNGRPAADTVKWDPAGRLRDAVPASDARLRHLIYGRSIGETFKGVLARLRDAELRAARAEARIVELQARAVLSA